MKRSFDPLNPPEIIGEAWKNEFHIFHWLYHVINHPNFMFYITTYKDNGKNNVCLHAWGYVDSDPDHATYFVLTLNKKGHTYQNIQRECGLHLECSVLWEKDIPQSNKVVIASQVEYVTLEQALLHTDYREKLSAFDTHLCYTKQINPLAGEMSAVGGEGKLNPALFENWKL